MNRFFQTAFTAALVISAASLSFSCTHRTGKVTQMPPMEAMGMLRNDFAVLIDVREENLQKEGIANGALSMPGMKEPFDRLPKDKRVIVYGSSPAEATKAAEQLSANGFDVGVIGTYEDWVKAGLPVQKR